MSNFEQKIKQCCQLSGMSRTQTANYLADLKKDLQTVAKMKGRKPKTQNESIAASGVQIAQLFANGLVKPVLKGDDPEEWGWNAANTTEKRGDRTND